MKISVITVTYNAEEVLLRTLKSVERQSFKNIEHLIIDGASKDGTLAIAEEYKQRVSYDVTILSEPDKGIYDAMNKGLHLAQGDYLVFLNAGDCLHAADTLELIEERGERREEREILRSEEREILRSEERDARCEEPAVIYGDTDIVDDEGRFLGHRHLSAPEKLSWKSFRRGMLVCHQSFYVRRDIAATIPYNLNYRFSADVDWCIRVMKEAESRGLAMVNTHAVLTDYLKEGQTTKNHRASLKERFIVMKHHYGLFTTIIMHLWFLLRNLK